LVGELLSAIKVIHVVDCQHDVALVQIHKGVSIDEHVLASVRRVAHRLRVGVQERPRLHVQVRAVVECTVLQNEVIERREEEEVVECLLVMAGEEDSRDDEMGIESGRVVGVAVLAEVVPDAVLVIRQVYVTVQQVNAYGEVSLAERAVQVQVGVFDR